MKIKITGVEDLEKELQQKSVTDFQSVSEKNVRAIYTRSQRPGGTPVKSNELRMSARYRGDEMGYTASYAPHVEYGHRLVNGGYVPGQYFLKKNVDIQRPIYKEDLKRKLKE
ncbi:hypothetical protein SFC08_14675 [Lysinibacillus halotolerans]